MPASGGIPEYREPKRMSKWRCRRKGGHFEGADFVTMGNIAVWSRVCPRCGAYLGPTEPLTLDAPPSGGLPQ